MTQFFDSIRDIKNNYGKYDQWEQEQADKNAQKNYLHQKAPLDKFEAKKLEDKAKTVIRAAELMDKRSEDNAENMEQKTGIIAATISTLAMFGASITTSLLQMSGKLKGKGLVAAKIGELSLALTIGLGFIFWGNKKQKEASRVGRFQARENELKDVKNFVQFTPEQIEAAKIIAKNIPDKKDKGGLLKVFRELKELSKDEVKYKKWLEERLKNPEDVNKVLNAKFTPEQLKNAGKDKELIINIIKDINIKAEEYSENCENMFDTLGTVSFLGSIPLGIGLNKLLGKMKLGGGIARGAVSIMAPLLVTIGIMAWGTKEQKKAARIGRYKARKELLNNPQLLRKFDDEQYKLAGHVKAPETKKGFFEKIGDNFKFLKTYFKDKKEYNNYLKTEFKENEKLHEALLQTQVTDAQLKDAKHIRDKTFMAFDKMDEMSQRYSEDAEAGAEATKQVVGLGWSLLSMGTLAAIPLLVIKGKFPIHKIGNWFSKLMLKAESPIRKTIEQGYNIINKDKELKSNLCKSLVSKEARASLMQNNALREIGSKLIGYRADLMTGLKGHLKDGKIAVWARNLVGDIINLVAKFKMESDLPFTYKNFKTLINTSLVAGIPVLGTIFAVPYAFNAWLTNIQKKSGKIGIMKAVNDLDNEKLFVNTQDTQTKSVA